MNAIAFSAGDIEATLTLKRDQFRKDLDAAKADAKKFADGKYVAKLQASSEAATRTIDKAQARADKFGRTTSTATLKVNTDPADRSIARTQKNAEGLGTAFAKVPLAISGIAAVLPSAISLTGVLAAGAAGIGGSFVTAGLAAAAFGSVAKPLFTSAEASIKAMTAAQLAYSKATTASGRLAALKAEKAAVDNLTPSEVRLAGSLRDIQGEWKQLTTALQPDVFRAVSPYLKTIETSMGLLPAVVRPAADAIHHVGGELEQLMSSGVTQRFAQFLGTEGGRSLGAGGSFLVDVLKSAEEILPQFRPLIDDADGALVRFGHDLETSAGSARTSNGIQEFISWAEKNAPVAEAFLKNLGGAIVNIGKAFASGGVGELRVLSSALSVIAKLPSGFLTPVVTGLTAISLLSKVSVGTSLLNGLGRLAGSATGITAAGSALRTFGGAAKDASVAEKGLAAASGALEAVTPVGWAIAGAAAITALGYVLVKNSNQVGGLIDQYRKQDQATGYNIAGYQKLAGQLTDATNQQTKLGQAVTLSTGPLRLVKDGTAAYSVALGEVNQGSEQAHQAATGLNAAMQGLGRQYGLSETAAISVAQAAGVSSTAWTGSAAAVAKARAQVEQYIITNEHALPGQRETNALIAAMGDQSLTTGERLEALNTDYQKFVGNLISKQQALAQAKSSIQSVNQQIRTTGISSHSSAAQIQSWIGELPGLVSQLGSSRGALSKFLGLEQAHISALLRTHGLTQTERSDLQGAQKVLNSVAESQRGLNARQTAWIDLTKSSYLPTLDTLHGDTKAVRADMDHLADSIQHTGAESQSTAGARAQLLKDLKQAGVNATAARKLVNQFSTAINDIPKAPKVHITVTGDGSFAVSQGGGKRVTTGPPGQSPRAAGGIITGGIAGQDSVPILAMPGEVVVPTAMVNSGEVDHLRGKLPGFASGGVVGRYSGTAPGLGKWTAQEVAATETAVEDSVASATAAAIKAALKAVKSIAGATTTAIGDLPANYRAIASFLTGHGYSHTGASGIAGNILQESGGNPESQGDNGNGLIGWTPARPGFVTGNPGRDLATQLNAILAYNNAQGGISTLNAQPTAASAAAYYMSHFERPAVATENAERREAGANAVFKAMGYASGTTGARPGWAKVGENGQELVHFHGGETVLPSSVTSRVLSTGVVMPGYAGGTGKIPPPKLTGPIVPVHPIGGGGSGGKRAKDEAELKKLQNQLAALEKKATGHLKELRLPIDREQLYLLQHPGISDARKKQIEAQISKQETAVSKYRKGAVSGEDKLSKEITLLKKIIAGDPKGKPPPVGKLPPGIGKLNQKQDLALLARDVIALAALKKAATAKLKKLRTPVEEDELYLLTHPGLGAGKKAAIEAALKKAQQAVSTYRKKVTGEEGTYSKEISLLRTLTGNPKDPKYGGAGSTDSGSGSGDDGSGSGGTTDTGPPPGQFVGTLPGAPGSFGGSDFTGGGSGGLGPGSASQLVSLPSAPAFSAAGGTGAAATGTSGSSNIEALLTQLLKTMQGTPAATGGHVAQAMNGISRNTYAQLAAAARWR